jgi:hypothetical protein
MMTYELTRSSRSVNPASAMRAAITVACLVMLLAVRAASATEATDTFGYRSTDSTEALAPTFDFIDISATAPIMFDGDDTSSGAITLGNPFRFYGQLYTELVMASNGYISTDTTDAGPDLSNDCPLPTTPSTGGGGRIYPLHDDLDLEAGIGTGYYEYFDVCPRPNDLSCDMGCSIFMWDDVAHFPGGSSAEFDFEAILYDNGHIVFQYGSGNTEMGSGSTTGIMDETFSFGLTHACDTAASIPDNFVVWIFLDQDLDSLPDSDSDGDFVDDACDICDGDDATGDTDGDGICDDLDICIGTDASGDTDGDGVCNDMDACAGDDLADADGDGVCDTADICEGDDATGDTDSDGVCDDTDICTGNDASGDSDGDGICDDEDLCFGDNATDDADGDGLCGDVDICTGIDASGDTDGDGICDNLDLCPNDPNKGAPGSCGCGEADVDTDGDDVPDCFDACPNDADKLDPGLCGCGSPDEDTDGDNILDCRDNCPSVVNSDQRDSNGDGVGDACAPGARAGGAVGPCAPAGPALLATPIVLLAFSWGRRRRMPPR